MYVHFISSVNGGEFGFALTDSFVAVGGAGAAVATGTGAAVVIAVANALGAVVGAASPDSCDAVVGPAVVGPAVVGPAVVGSAGGAATAAGAAQLAKVAAVAAMVTTSGAAKVRRGF
jgi:hypothetical protein